MVNVEMEVVSMRIRSLLELAETARGLAEKEQVKAAQFESFTSAVRLKVEQCRERAVHVGVIVKNKLRLILRIALV